METTPLFSQVYFHIIESEDIDGNTARELSKILIQHGASEHSPPSSSGRVSMRGLTHIVTTTIDFEAYVEATDNLVNVVTPGWVETSIAKNRASNPKSHSPDPRLFYSGFVVCTADLPEGDKDAIIGGVLAMGGLYSGSISKSVTHIVALNMEPQACQIAVAKNLQCKIVLPHWFDDCLRLGKKIDEGPYLLPNPEIMRKRPGDPVVSSIRPDLRGAVSANVGDSAPLHEPSPAEPGRVNVFKDKKVMLGNDLAIADHLRATIEGIIKQGGGGISDSATDCDIFVCQYRDGNDYLVASRDSKIVGNLPWLYHLITRNSWTSPLKRLLHYPIARGGLPGVKEFRICLSNYNGEARIYLGNLAKAAGCEFTKNMKQDNTHLITAHTKSEKCDAAREWNIHIINHLWLEESYAKWKIQSITSPRFTHFPISTNLTEIVGQTPIDKDALARNFFSVPPQQVSNAINNTTAGHDQLEHGPSKQQSPPPGNEKATGRTSDQQEQYITYPVTDTSGSKLGHEPTTPHNKRFMVEDKENDTSSTSVTRSAKNRANARLHSLAPDIALYERETKRVGGVVFGGRRKKEDTVEASRKRSLSSSDQHSESSEHSNRQTKTKQRAKSPLQMRVLVTGYSRWTDDPKLYSKEKERLRAIGILVMQDYKNCTYLAAPKILRTQKFCCAIAQSPIIISTEYLEACLEHNALLRQEEYLLKDVHGEGRLGHTLEKALQRAKVNRGRLLRGHTVWITEGIHGGFDSYRSIVEMNGGKCSVFRGRAGSMTTTTSISTDQEDKGDSVTECAYLISGQTNGEAKLWSKFRQMAEMAGVRATVVRTDWLLDLALSQEIGWKDTYELTEADVTDERQAV